MTNPVITYHPNGQPSTITHRNTKGQYHNLSGPSVIWYDKDGQKEYEWYYSYGKNVDIHKLIKELDISSDYTLWTDIEKDMVALHLMLEVV